MSTSRFAPLTVHNAAEAARPIVAASTAEFGFTPSPVAKAAQSPVLLKHLLTGFAAFERTSLSHMEREVLALAVAFHNECHYCMAMHSTLLSKTPENGPIVAAMRAGRPLDAPRLEAVRRFVTALLERRGHVTSEELTSVEAAGFTEEQALDLVLGVGVYVLSTFTNSVVGAEIDEPFAAFRWQKPGPSAAPVS